MTAPLDWRWWKSSSGPVWHRASTASLVPRTSIPTRTLCGRRISLLWVSRPTLPPGIVAWPCAHCYRKVEP